MQRKLNRRLERENWRKAKVEGSIEKEGKESGKEQYEKPPSRV